MGRQEPVVFRDHEQDSVLLTGIDHSLAPFHGGAHGLFTEHMLFLLCASHHDIIVENMRYHDQHGIDIALKHLIQGLICGHRIVFILLCHAFCILIVDIVDRRVLQDFGIPDAVGMEIERTASADYAKSHLPHAPAPFSFAIFAIPSSALSRIGINRMAPSL